MYSLDQIHLDRWTWTSPSEYQMDQTGYSLDQVILGPVMSHLEVIYMLKYAVKIHTCIRKPYLKVDPNILWVLVSLNIFWEKKISFEFIDLTKIS